MAEQRLGFDVYAKDNASKVFDRVGMSAHGLGSKIGRIGKVAALGLGGAAVGGVIGLGAALKDAFSSAADLQKITGQTSAAIKSTGGAAGVSAKHVRDLANQINNYSTLDDDVVQQGENMLLTFKNIRNEAGKNNKIFDQASKTLADMSTAMGTAPKDAAIQLGKALNDPIKGISALSRVGVTFTDKQKNTIKSLVDSGHTMKAQKIILRELNSEFGGSAKAAGSTFSGALFHLKDGLQDALRDGVAPLLPYLSKAANWLGDKLPGAVQAVIDWVKRVVSSFRNGSGAVGGFTAWFKDKLIPALKDLWSKQAPAVWNAVKGVINAFRDNKDTIHGLWQVISATLIPTLKLLYTVYIKDLVAKLKAISTVLNDFVFPAIKLIIKTFLTLVGTIIDGAAKAFGWIKGIGGPLKKAAREFDKFRDDVNNSLDGIKNRTVTVTAKYKENRQSVYSSQVPAFTTGKSKKHRASGGPVYAGEQYTVGENGEEQFIPAVNGYIQPHGQPSSGTVVINLKEQALYSGRQILAMLQELQGQTGKPLQIQTL